MKIDKKKILFLTARFPYPLFGGDRLKPYKLLEYLGKNYDTTLVSFNRDELTSDADIVAIRKLGVKVELVPLSTKRAILSSGFTLLSKKPLEIDFYYSKAFQKRVDTLIEKNKYDIAFAFFMRTAEYIKKKNIKKVLIAEDCRTLYQYRSFKESTTIPQKAVRLWEYLKLKKYEPNIMDKFDIVSFVTNEDIESSKLQNPKPKYMLLTNGTDIDKFKPDGNIERKDILFTGRLDIWANQMMIHRIINEILPEIRKTKQNAKLKIVGGYPPESIKALKSDNIEIIENVPDMLPYLQEARCYLHPHRGASGIQNKLLEAMATGCPVATSQTGNQGIYAIDGKDAFICNSNKEFVDKSVILLNDDKTADLMSKNARQLIVDTHSWETVYQQLEKIISEL